MIRLLIEDITLTRNGYEVDVYVRFKTGTVIKAFYRVPRSGHKPTDIGSHIIEKIDHLASKHTAGQIATKLNETRVIHPTRGTFDTNAIGYLMKRFNIPSLKQRLKAAGYLSRHEVAERCGVTALTVQRWRRQGWIIARPYNDQPEYLYEPTLEGLPVNIARRYDAFIPETKVDNHDSEKRV